MTTDDDNAVHWRLDKKVPLVLIVGMVVQTLAFVWWAGAASQRLTDLEKKAEGAAPQIERLVRVETKMDGLLDSIKELKTTLQRMPPIQRN